MDYSLYNKVKQIVNAKTREEAESLLFGIDGLNINTKEYYQKIITEFTRKKEGLIYKIGDDIIFDLENNKEEVFNIIFLGKYISEHKEGFTKEEFFKAFEDEKERVKISGREIENVNSNTIEELKESIRWIQKFKDSFKHNENGDSYDFNLDTRKVVINNEGGSFPLTVEVPIEYIEGFNKGNILALPEDKNLEKYAIELTDSLLEELGDNIANYENFFYHISPQVLDEVLGLVNNDIKELYKLPIHFFINYNNVTKFLLKSYGFESIKEFSDELFISKDVTEQIIKEFGIDNTRIFPKGSLSATASHWYYDKIGFSQNYFDSKKFEKEVKLLEKTGNLYDWESVEKEIIVLKRLLNIYDVDQVRNLTHYDLIKIYDNYETILVLDKFGIENYKYIRHVPIEYMDKISDFIKEHDISMIKNLPASFFDNYYEGKKILDKYGINAIKNIFESMEEKSLLAVENKELFLTENERHHAEKFMNKIGAKTLSDFYKFFESTDKKGSYYLDIFMKKNGFCKLKRYFDFFESTPPKGNSIFLQNGESSLLKENHLYYLYEFINNYGIEPLGEISVYSISNPYFTSFLIKKYGIETVKKFPDGVFLMDKKYEVSSKIIESYIHKYGIETVAKLPDAAFINPKTFKMIEKTFGFKVANNENFLFKYICGKRYPEDMTIDHIFQYFEVKDNKMDSFKTIGKNYILKKIIDNYGVDSLDVIPYFSSDYIIPFLEHVDELGLDTIKKIYSIKDTSSTKSYIELIKEFGFEKSKDYINLFPNLEHYKKFSDNNTKVMLKKVDGDYDRLSEFPEELFSCDSDILNEMLVKYDSNIMRSIFGMNDPKAISALIYLDSALSKYNANIYQENKKDLNRLANIDCQILKDDSKINAKLESAVDEEHGKFVGLVKSFYIRASDDPELYVNTIAQKYVEGQEKVKTKLGAEINNEVIRHMRNSISHFYFNLDKDGMVRLYDKNDAGDTIFDKKYKVKELIEFAHGIEQFLNNDEKPKDLGTIATELNNKHTMDTVNSELVTIIRAFKEKDQLLEKKSVKSK